MKPGNSLDDTVKIVNLQNLNPCVHSFVLLCDKTGSACPAAHQSVTVVSEKALMPSSFKLSLPLFHGTLLLLE